MIALGFNKITAFAVCYSIGTVLSLASSCFLWGPWHQIKNMFKVRHPTYTLTHTLTHAPPFPRLFLSPSVLLNHCLHMSPHHTLPAPLSSYPYLHLSAWLAIHHDKCPPSRVFRYIASTCYWIRIELQFAFKSMLYLREKSGAASSVALL